MPSGSADQDLCQTLLDRLKHTDSRCILTAVGQYPDFASPPWQSLDASQHLDLIAKLVRYRGIPASTAPTDQELSARLREAKNLVQAGGTLKIWQTRLLTFFDGNAQFPAPPGNQTIVLMSKKLSAENCPAYASMTFSHTFVVLPDLSGPDLSVKHEVVYDLATSYPVLYKGRTLLVNNAISYVGMSVDELNDGSQITVYQLTKETGTNSSVCAFWYKADNQSKQGR